MVCGADASYKNPRYFSNSPILGGAKRYHSRSELIKDLTVKKEFCKNITGLAPILTVKEFMDKKLKKEDEGFYFTRQSLNEKGKLTPDLPHQCACRRILNPDDAELMPCPKYQCNVYLHRRCIALSTDRRCPDCSAKVVLYTPRRESPKKVQSSPVKKRMAMPLPQKRVKVDVEEKCTWTYPTLAKDFSERLDDVIHAAKEENRKYNITNKLTGIIKKRKIA